MLSREEIFDLAEPFGEFQYGDAQGDKRVAFARAVEAAAYEQAAQECEKRAGPIETYNRSYPHYLACAAAIRYDAITGNRAEQRVCAQQMLEAANEIETLREREAALRAEIEALRGAAKHARAALGLVLAKELA